MSEPFDVRDEKVLDRLAKLVLPPSHTCSGIGAGCCYCFAAALLARAREASALEQQARGLREALEIEADHIDMILDNTSDLESDLRARLEYIVHHLNEALAAFHAQFPPALAKMEVGDGCFVGCATIHTHKPDSGTGEWRKPPATEGEEK